MISHVALVSTDADIVCGFRTIFSSVCRLRVFADYVALQSALCERSFDFVFIDVAFARSPRGSFSAALFANPSFRCFYLSALPNPAAYNEHAVLRFPQDMAFLLAGDAERGRTFSAEQEAVLSRLVGESAAMQSLKKHIVMAAQSDIPVLITGETGVGKGLVAQTIHRLSSRGSRDFVSVNVTENPDGLEAASLFGTVRGAFTDAQNRTGYFERAQNTTLFLDEIGELKRDVQAKLLYAVENGRFRSVGAEQEKCTNARLLFATNADLQKRMARGEFREDLYYRISRLRIHIPPLRERKEDIVPLARCFAARAHKRLSYLAEELLTTFPWKGNVRQLSHCIERAGIVCGGDTIDVAHITVD